MGNSTMTYVNNETSLRHTVSLGGHVTAFLCLGTLGGTIPRGHFKQENHHQRKNMKLLKM